MEMEAEKGMDRDSRTYLSIDLKSFYASVECVDQDLDPMTENLVVADVSRTEKTICLAVSPALKSFGIPGRPRLFEVIQKVKELNARRLSEAIRLGKAVRGPDGRYGFSGSSSDIRALSQDPSLELSFRTVPPRMSRYVHVSAFIYSLYLKYIAPEDIHVYSIDEVFIDVTGYLFTYRMTARELAGTLIREIQSATGITAAAGIGTNLYLAKVAMDIVAKHVPADRYGVRIAELDELAYRRLLWTHKPLTDFWRIGPGYARKLQDHGLFTMGDIARCSVGNPGDYYNEDLLYKLFGVNAELLIDHAWGWEPCTIADIRAYRPQTNSVGAGQVLTEPYDFEHARLVVREMTDVLVLDLVDKGLVTDQLVLTVGYDIENLTGERGGKYRGPVTTDRYGRRIPKHAHGTGNLEGYSSSTRQITDCMMQLYDRIVDKELLVRRITLAANHVIPEAEAPKGSEEFQQLELFTDPADERKRAQEQADLAREKQLQKAALEIKKKYGKNALLKGMNLQEGATARDRNRQIGGHRA